MGKTLTATALVGTVAGVIGLLVQDPAAAAALARRLAPIFAFVVGMSVVVNIAAQSGAFDAIAGALERFAPAAQHRRPVAIWLGILLLAVVSTVFLSLDTTAILITPVAISLAKRNRVNIMAVALSIVWIANIASLPLPVSNLTNLLAVGSGAFGGQIHYIRSAFAPGMVAVVVATLASWLVLRRVPSSDENSKEYASQPVQPDKPEPALAPADALQPAALVTLAALLPALASPIAFWLSSTVAAALLGLFAAIRKRDVLTINLVPWPALLFAAAFASLATCVNGLGGAQLVHAGLSGAENSVAGLFLLAGAGAVASNLINNIPAFLALEPAVSTAHGYFALLIGVNAGAIVTPWASLATLLWHDQLRRAGVELSWRKYMTYGVVLAPAAVGIPVAALAVPSISGF